MEPAALGLVLCRGLESVPRGAEWLGSCARVGAKPMERAALGVVLCRGLQPEPVVLSGGRICTYVGCVRSLGWLGQVSTGPCLMADSALGLVL